MFAEVLKQFCLQNKLVNSLVASRVVKKGLHGQLDGMQDILHTKRLKYAKVQSQMAFTHRPMDLFVW